MVNAQRRTEIRRERSRVRSLHGTTQETGSLRPAEPFAFATASARPGHSPDTIAPGGGWRSQLGCSAGRMQLDAYHGLRVHSLLAPA